MNGTCARCGAALRVPPASFTVYCRDCGHLGEPHALGLPPDLLVAWLRLPVPTRAALLAEFGARVLASAASIDRSAGR